MANLNPLELKIIDIKIEKFNNQDRMSIFPQFIELSIYQSLFEPVIKAELVINDTIGLFVNYPFTGEELITINYQHISNQGSDYSVDRITPKQLQFIIKGVRNIVMSDKARSLMYIVDLVSVEFLQNVKKYVSHAFNDRLEDAAEKVYEEYIANDTQIKFKQSKNFNKEKSVKVRRIIVPNLRPLQAIQWLAKHAVSADYDNKFLYLFYENFDGFNFTTIQQLIKDALDNKDLLIQNKYQYVSDKEIVQNDPADTSDPNSDLRLITNVVTNKRFSSIEKIAGGYYQSELFEINMLQKSYNSANTELDPTNTGQYMLGKNPLNTTDYINYVKNQIDGVEYSNRIRYIINNYEDTDTENRGQPDYRLKFGPATRYLYALNQIDLSITVPANMDLNVGDVIYCIIPEMHGFNTVLRDIYISGFFIISEIKHVLGAGNRAATTMRIYKDGYSSAILETSEYNTSTFTPRISTSGKLVGTV